MRYIWLRIGCLECGVPTEFMGIYDGEEAARGAIAEDIIAWRRKLNADRERRGQTPLPEREQPPAMVLRQGQRAPKYGWMGDVLDVLVEVPDP